MHTTCHRVDADSLPVFLKHRIAFALLFSGPKPQDEIDALTESNRIYFEKAIADQSFLAYMAQRGGEVAGIGGMVIREQPGGFHNPSGRVGYLMLMYTVPEFRRQGVCTEILHALMRDAAQMGVTAFELHASEEGELVYRQHGFLMHGEPTYRKYITVPDRYSG